MLDLLLWNISVQPKIFTRVLFYSFLQRLHLQKAASHDFIKLIKERRLGVDFTWAGRLF